MPAIPLPDPELADGVIRLRSPRPADVPAITAACQDPLIQRFTFVPPNYTEAHARDWVGSEPLARERGEALSLVIAPAGGDEVLGTVGLLRPDWLHRTAEIGYWVAPSARGRGAATRAVALLAPWALRTLRLQRLSADVDVDNDASQRVAQRAGFVREGVLRSAIEAKGRRWSLVVHSLLPEDLA
ncbi:MAG TPA: GNAT family protein [Baekduia sp.]|uniref:GNAT family N-acetyltransferase n=1 Tax=Baekduia sp. TaxID=2600305 RepID=UPI002B770737|nr:GNAT family protein [Baekduia sp.]HMJ36909.1 GNAT family protein [Baekduia sp.]